MPAPLAKGLIIAASVLVAAGIAIYESPQVRHWVDNSRRKIAVALHSLGDDIQPRRSSPSPEDEAEERRKRRDGIVLRNKLEMIRKAREEGIAVDLDELNKIGRESSVEERGPRKSGGSFDDLVGSDGMLKDNHPLIKEENPRAETSAMQSTEGDLRRRGRLLNGFESGSTAANPFADELLFDRELIGPSADETPSPNPFIYNESRESTATLPPSEPAPLIDLHMEDPPASVPELPQTASIPSLSNSAHWSQHREQRSEDQDPSQSFYSFTTSSNSSHLPSQTHSTAQLIHPNVEEEEELEIMSTGTLTPRSDGFSTAASMVPSQADDIAVLSMQSDDDHDARSEVFSEGGFTEAGFSEAGFSERSVGAMTPNSWTDVGSDDESEFGGPAGGNQSQGSQLQQAQH